MAQFYIPELGSGGQWMQGGIQYEPLLNIQGQ